MKISEQAMAGFPAGLSEADVQLLQRTGLAALRRSILVRLKQAAGCCVETSENRFEDRERLATLSQIGRDIDRLATAGVIMLRELGGCRLPPC